MLFPHFHLLEVTTSKNLTFFLRHVQESCPSAETDSGPNKLWSFWHLIMETKWHYWNFPLKSSNWTPIWYNDKDPEPFLSVSTFPWTKRNFLKSVEDMWHCFPTVATDKRKYLRLLVFPYYPVAAIQQETAGLCHYAILVDSGLALTHGWPVCEWPTHPSRWYICSCLTQNSGSQF